MPIGNSYPRDVVIEDADLFLGTKASLNNTVNYTAQGIANYLNINGKVSISGQMSFKFVEINEVTGTISFDGGGGDGTYFSDISQLIVSIMDLSEQEVNIFLAYLNGKEILLAQQNKINSFGNYKIIEYTVTTNPNFYTLDLEYIGGNGTILKDKYYDLVAFSSSAGGTPYVLPTASSTILGGVKIGDGISIDIDGKISATTITDVISDVEVGGINIGATVAANTNLQEFVEQILYKTYDPLLYAPTFSLSNNAGIREIGSSSSFNLTFNFDRGNILGATVSGVWQPATSQGPRAGISSSYFINGVTQSSNILVVSPVLLPLGNPYTATVTYNEGQQPLDSKGNYYDLPLSSGTSPYQPTTIQGIYPYFWWKSPSPITAAGMQTAISNGSATKVVDVSTSTITITFAATGQYLAFAYPETSTTKTVWFVTSLNSGFIPGGVFGSATVLPCNSPTSLWSGVDYKIHVSPGLITESGAMQLRNS